jgi:uncharacterized membrane protein
MSGFQDAPRPWSQQSKAAADARPAADPEDLSDTEFRTFVQSLIARVEGRLTKRLEPEVQNEIANLLGLLIEMPRKAVVASRVYFELAFDVLGAEQPNLVLARSIRLELSAINDSRSKGVTRLISYICGSTPLNAAIAALIASIVISLMLLWLMITGHREFLRDVAGTSTLLTTLNDGSVTLLIIAIHSAFLGGIVSIVARIQDFLSGSTFSPPLIFISVIRKPFLAATFVVLVFSIMKIGLVSFPGVSLTGPNAPYVAWAVGLLCGFSERFAQDFVVSASGRFGQATPRPPPDAS